MTKHRFGQAWHPQPVQTTLLRSPTHSGQPFIVVDSPIKMDCALIGQCKNDNVGTGASRAEKKKHNFVGELLGGRCLG